MIIMPFDILEDGPKILDAPVSEFEKWMSRGFNIRIQKFGHEIFFYSPTSYPHNITDHQITNPDNFVSLSVTGAGCSLMCKHCEGRLLKGMESTATPDSLYQRCEEISAKGGEGVLISGGSDSRGHVPLDRYIDVIARVKRDLNLKVVVHTGLIDKFVAEGLGLAGIDAAMLDIIGDEKVSESIYNIPNGPKKMNQSMALLSEMNIPIVPHLLVGLNYGQLSGEIEALEMISNYHPHAVVIIALNPIRKTAMESTSPPSPEDIARIMTIARIGIPDRPLLLGCARPLGTHKIDTDLIAIRSGVNGIAYVSQEGVDYAKHKGLDIFFRDVCCSLAYQMIEPLAS